MRGIKVPQAPPRSARPPPRAGAIATYQAIETAKVFGWHKVRPTEVAAPTRRSGTARLISLTPNVLCGWLLHSKTFLMRFLRLSEAVMCPACLRGFDRWP